MSSTAHNSFGIGGTNAPLHLHGYAPVENVWPSVQWRPRKFYAENCSWENFQNFWMYGDVNLKFRCVLKIQMTLIFAVFFYAVQLAVIFKTLYLSGIYN